MIELWWTDDGQDVCRAKFRALPDALRYAWRYGRAEDARIRREDGSWHRAVDFPMPRAVVVAPRPAPTSGQATAQTGRSRSGQAAPLVDTSDVTLEVMRQTGITDAALVERIVDATLQVLNGMRRRPDRR